MLLFCRGGLNRIDSKLSPQWLRLANPLIALLLVALAGTIGQITWAADLNAPATSSGRQEESSSYLATLAPGDRIASFEATALYMTDTDRIGGARFTHQSTGMPVDILLFDSIPQAMVWIQSPPVSDRGEPHAGEHLVLGKGKKGKLFSLLLDMSMGSNSAGTYRDKTLYHFHTAGGRQSFLELTYRMFDTLLHPDFTDEEIRREVAHLGVMEDPETGELSVEERGTVYLEMVSAFEKPGSLAWNKILQSTYGATHPLGMESGGHPDAIREMEPHHIRQFFSETYVPGKSIGLIVGLPGSFEIARFLSDLDGIFRKSFNGYYYQHTDASVLSPNRELPSWETPVDEQIHRCPYPAADATDPGCAIFGWPARADISLDQAFRLETLWHLLAGDETAYLYKDLIDSSTRRGPKGLANLSGWINSTAGRPPMIWFDGVKPELLAADSLIAIRQVIVDRLAWIRSLEAGTADLAQFNQKAMTYLTSYQRFLREQIEAPPRFGYRGTGDFWYRRIIDLAKSGNWQRDLLETARIADLQADLESGNIWAELISEMNLVDAKITTVASYPDPELPARQHQDKLERLSDAEEELKRRYATNDGQEAIRLYQTEFAARTAKLDAIEAEIPRPGFLADPPLTLDEMIDTRLDSLTIAQPVDSTSLAMEPDQSAGEAKSIPLCINRFEHTSQIETGLFFNIRDIDYEDLIYLPLLPLLITDLGCWADDSTWLPYDQLNEQLQREINSLESSYSSFPRARGGRLELAIFGSGLGQTEGMAAVSWTRRLLESAIKIDETGRGRLIDILKREVANLRQMPLRSEEAWVNNPARAYRYQRDRAYLSANSIFTRQHHCNRLVWRLRDAPTADAKADLETALQRVLTGADRSREAILSELTAMTIGGEQDSVASDLVHDAADYLSGELALFPDETLFQDLTRLAGQLLDDLSMSPQTVLTDLNRVMGALLSAGPSRALITGNSRNIEWAEDELTTLIEGIIAQGNVSQSTLQDDAVTKEAPVRSGDRNISHGVIVNHLKQRYPWLEKSGAGIPAYAALGLESTRNAVFINSAPLTSYGDIQNGEKIDYLTSKLYGGSGAHGLFMRTWAAGLAYSNGIGSSARSGLVSYYAERCSDGTETLRYITELMNDASETIDGNFFLDYALANSFGDYRGGDTYISRGRAMANDLADGFDPERIRKFKRSLLRQRNRWQNTLETTSAPEKSGLGQNFLTEMIESLPRIAGPVIPGYGHGAGGVKGAVNYMIGPSNQIDDFTEFLSSKEPLARPVRLYQSDYWID